MDKKATPFSHIFSYSLGDGAFSLVWNTISGFAMFFYTQALGISSNWASIVLAVPMFWDAIADPIMGHISDNTRSRYGRRHPHILIGGVLLALCYFLVWYVPQPLQGSQLSIVIYLIIVNMVSRTLFAWYYVPYVALGFEICTDYNEKSKLQSTRFVVNMVFNLLFCGVIVWKIFLVNQAGQRDTTIQNNYAHMGFVFSAVILILILITVFSTRRYAVDTSHEQKIQGNDLKSFIRDFIEIFKDRNTVLIFAFFTTAYLSFVFVACIQMYVYVSFMNFTSTEASIVHSSTMIGCALGSLSVAFVSKKIDKKPSVYLGSFFSMLANVGLASLFLTGLIKPQSWPVGNTYISTVVFGTCNALFWFGSGFLTPMVYSMLSDVSEINKIKTGFVKDGSYSAILLFLTKVATSLGLVVVGKCLGAVGFKEGSDIQTPEVALQLTRIMVFLGIFFTVVAVGFIVKYPVDKKYMADIKAKALPVAG